MSDHGHEHGYRAQSRRALGIVLALTGAYTVCEIVGGWLTGSLALLADAGHMLGDSAALVLALVAAWLAGRPATPERSFGYRRAEILAALANGVALAVIAIWVFIEAVQRLDSPREILGGWMLAVALIGLAVNAVAAGILSRAGDNLNVRAALRHVFADLAGSVGVAVAALIVLTTGWERADPVAGMAIGVLILGSSWSIVRDSVSILLEATPAESTLTRSGGAWPRSRASSRCTTCTSGRSRPAFPRSRLTSSCGAATIATCDGASSSSFSPRSSGSSTRRSRSSTSASGAGSRSSPCAAARASTVSTDMSGARHWDMAVSVSAGRGGIGARRSPTPAPRGPRGSRAGPATAPALRSVGLDLRIGQRALPSGELVARAAQALGLVRAFLPGGFGLPL